MMPFLQYLESGFRKRKIKDRWRAFKKKYFEQQSD